MLKLKKNVIKYKSEDGSMLDASAIIGQEVTDMTLTKAGTAADAKKVGDKISEIQQSKADVSHVHSFEELENKPFYKEVIQNIRLSYIATKTSETTLAMNVLWSDLYNLYNWDGKISYADKILDVSVIFSESNGYSYLEIDGVSTSFPPDSIKEIILTGEEFVENSYQVNFCEETENIKTIDVEFLPDMVGEKSDAIGCEIFNTYEGYDKNTASGYASHAEGSGTTANGVGAHAEGYYAVASKDYAHAEGYRTTASSYASHAEGDYTTASGEHSHAEGNGTTASGNNSHAEGNNTVSSGENSHAEGSNTTASGNESHAEGAHTVSSGEYSHAEGYLTIASGRCQHVQGECNIEDIENEYAHIVGNGDTDYVRSNAHTIDWKGNAWFSGDVYTGSTSGTNKDEGSKKLATEDYVTTELSDYYLKSEVDTIHTELHDYVDAEVAALVNAAPETLDTLGELAEAFNENKEVVEALDASITNKQDKVSDVLILVDTVTGIQHKIQIQNGQLVSFPVTE